MSVRRRAARKRRPRRAARHWRSTRARSARQRCRMCASALRPRGARRARLKQTWRGAAWSCAAHSGAPRSPWRAPLTRALLYARARAPERPARWRGAREGRAGGRERGLARAEREGERVAVRAGGAGPESALRHGGSEARSAAEGHS